MPDSLRQKDVCRVSGNSELCFRDPPRPDGPMQSTVGMTYAVSSPYAWPRLSR